MIKSIFPTVKLSIPTVNAGTIRDAALVADRESSGRLPTRPESTFLHEKGQREDGIDVIFDAQVIQALPTLPITHRGRVVVTQHLVDEVRADRRRSGDLVAP